MSLKAGHLLLDLQGVLYQEGAVLEGAVEALAALRRRGLALRFLTNTTTRSRRDIARRMGRMGFEATSDEVITPAVAAGGVLKAMGARAIHLAADPDLAADLRGFDLVDRDPDAVVLGDLHRDFTFDRINGLFRMLDGGARLVALHRNRVCIRDGTIGLDLGPFVAALEYATGRSAVIVGKPSETFFAMALAELGADAADTVMVGDDITSDIAGARAAGLRTVQVRTGKYRPADDDAEVQPDLRIDSIAELSAALF